ncbi:hypothetical protein Tco_0357908, partial [Tanacetum coccineum]
GGGGDAVVGPFAGGVKDGGVVCGGVGDEGRVVCGGAGAAVEPTANAPVFPIFYAGPREGNIVTNIGGEFMNMEILKCWSFETSRRLFNTKSCS